MKAAGLKMEHKSVSEIIDVVKKHLGASAEKKVKNKEVAEAIGATEVELAMYKHRNAVPYNKLLNYCHKTKCNCNEIFLNNKEIR